MQLIGAWFADQTVLNASAAYQSATDWHTRRPAIALHERGRALTTKTRRVGMIKTPTFVLFVSFVVKE